MDNLLSILTFTPLLAGLILAIFLRGDDEAARQNAKWLALTATGATFFVAVAIFLGFDEGATGFQFQEERPAPFGLTYRMGIDGISLGFVMLTTALMPIVVGLSWPLTERVKHYVIALLAFETALLAAFLATDIIFFVVFFEAAMIPLLLMAGQWGRKGAGVQALKAWLYTVPGTILLIVAASAMVREAGTTDLADLMRHNFFVGEGALPGGAQGALWLMVAASVAVKAGVWPLHGWLPGLAFRTALPVGLLAAVLVTKLGLYGIVRILAGLLPVAWEGFLPLTLALGGIGLVLGVLTAITREDLGRGLAYIVIAQSGMALVVLSAGTVQGHDGALLGVMAQGLAVAGLYALAAMLQARGNSREIGAFGSLKAQLPVLTTFFLAFALVLAGAPGTGLFAALVLSGLGLAPANMTAALIFALGAVLMASFAFLLYRRLMLGARVKESFKLVSDLDGRERLLLVLLLVAIALLGLWPGLVLERTAPAFGLLIEQLAAPL